MKIHHVGYLTKNLKAAREEFIRLGFRTEQAVCYDDIRKINIEFMTNDGYRVELIEPADKESPMYPLLKNYKNTPYHFCYITEDIDAAVRSLEESGYHVLQAREKAPCIDDHPVVFLMHAKMGIIELVEM